MKSVAERLKRLESILTLMGAFLFASGFMVMVFGLKPIPVWVGVTLVFVSMLIFFIIVLAKKIEELEKLKLQLRPPLPAVIGLEILVNRWQEFKKKLDRDDSKTMYTQILSAQQIFAGTNINTITFIEAFPGNKPQKGVYLVQPEDKPIQVLKFDRIENLREERNRYDQYVKGRLAFVPGKPISYWPPQSDWDRISAGDRGTVVYELAQMNLLTSASSQTFGQYYVEKSGPAVVKALEEIISKLDYGWWRHSISNERNLFHEYTRLHDEGKLALMKARLEEVRKETDKVDFSSQQYFSLRETNFAQTEYRNPLDWVGEVFADLNTFSTRLGDLDTRDARRDSIVHGDFHAGNILIEEDQGQPRVWLIDFPHTHVGPTVQDIARLEADIKFGHFPEKFLRNKQIFDAILTFENTILGNGTRRGLDLSESEKLPFQVEGVTGVDSELDKVWQVLTILRRPVRHSYLSKNDARPYYLALLHATLPMLYYRDRSPWQKLYAFISAALLCERLGR